MTGPTQYRKRPVVIQAMRMPERYPEGVDPASDDYARNLAAVGVLDWMSANGYPGLVGNALDPDSLRYPDQADGDDSRPDKGWYIDPTDGYLLIRTLEGDMRVAPGDYVILGVEGEFYPCKPDIFAKTYEAGDEPSALAEIAAERARQIQLGWDAEHDEQYGVDHLVQMAGSYAYRGYPLYGRFSRRRLVQAAALLVAAIEHPAVISEDDR